MYRYNDDRDYKRIIVGKEIKTRNEINLEYRSELLKKLCDFLTYSILKLHKKLNHRYIETEIEYEQNIYEFKKVA
jgi:hypothetical protein